MEYRYDGNSLKSGIYKLTNRLNGRFYLGSAKRFKERWSQHTSSLRNKKHHNKFLQADFNKCGEEVFMFEVVEVIEGTKEERLRTEQKLLDECFDRKIDVYNLSPWAISPDGYYPKNAALTKKRRCAVAKRRYTKHPELLIDLHKAQKEHFLAHPADKMAICSLGGKSSAQKRMKTYTFYDPNGNRVEIRELTAYCEKNGLSVDLMLEVYAGRAGHHKGWTNSGVAKKRAVNHDQLRALQKNKWANPDTRKKMVEGMKEYWETHPEKKEAYRAMATAQNAKSYELLSPDNILVIINNMSQFCREHPELNVSGMIAVARGRFRSYKGWKRV